VSISEKKSEKPLYSEVPKDLEEKQEKFKRKTKAPKRISRMDGAQSVGFGSQY